MKGKDVEARKLGWYGGDMGGTGEAKIWGKVWEYENMEFGIWDYGRVEGEKKRRVDDGKKRRGSRACP